MGKKHTEESKRKMSVSHTGKPRSEEERRRISEGQKGKKRGPRSEESKRKISESHKGLKNSEESRRKISLAHGGTGDLNSKYPSSKSWCRRNKERTPYCQFCFSEDNLHAHHIIQKAKFPQYHDEDWNCRILCEDCHKICHKQGGY